MTKQTTAASLEPAIANADAAFKLSIPFFVEMREAGDVARFFAKHWASLKHDHHVVKPGLDTAAGADPTLGQQIALLEEMALAAQNAYLLASDPKSGAGEVDRAHFVCEELDATLAHWFEAHGDQAGLAQLQRLRDEHQKSGDSAAALGVELGAYAMLAEPLKAKLDGVGGFDGALVDEAKALATELADKPSAPGVALGPHERAALERRNRILDVLQQKVNKVRADARFVFRHDRDVVREATSAYERTRRRKARARATAPSTPAPAH
jgi:hypothetical protein